MLGLRIGCLLGGGAASWMSVEGRGWLDGRLDSEKAWIPWTEAVGLGRRR